MNKNLDSSLAVFNAHHSCLRATTSAYSYGTVIHTPACCFSQSVRAAGEYFDCGLLSARRSQQIRGPADRGNHGWTVGLSETKGGSPWPPVACASLPSLRDSLQTHHSRVLRHYAVSTIRAFRCRAGRLDHRSFRFFSSRPAPLVRRQHRHGQEHARV